MGKNKNHKIKVRDYLDSLTSKSRHYFTTKELEAANLSLKDSSISVSLSRLAKRGKLKMIRRGFGILTPSKQIEIHPTYYLNAMMKFLEAEYYVGLLS